MLKYAFNESFPGNELDWGNRTGCLHYAFYQLHCRPNSANIVTRLCAKITWSVNQSQLEALNLQGRAANLRHFSGFSRDAQWNDTFPQPDSTKTPEVWPRKQNRDSAPWSRGCKWHMPRGTCGTCSGQQTGDLIVPCQHQKTPRLWFAWHGGFICTLY